MPDQLFSPNSFQTFGDLLKYLRRRERPSLRFLVVVGASGSGKSSLVRAGLAVALKQAGRDGASEAIQGR